MHLRLSPKRKSSKSEDNSSSSSSQSHHRLSPSKSVASLYRSASRLTRSRSRSRSSSQATAVPSTTTHSTVVPPEVVAKELAQAAKEEKEAEGALYKLQPTVQTATLADQLPVSETSTAVDYPLPDMSSKITDAKSKVKSDAHATAEKAKSEYDEFKAEAQAQGKKAKDAAAKTTEELKEVAAEAGDSIKKTASTVCKKTDDFLKALYASIVGATTTVASATKTTVLKYPIAASNVTALLAAGLTAYAVSGKGCPKCTGVKTPKHFYQIVASVVGGTLAVVDSFALYYAKNQKQLKE